jgi:hypothetical protein
MQVRNPTGRTRAALNQFASFHSLANRSASVIVDARMRSEFDV